MCPEVVAGLFRKFNQGDTSTTRRFGGTGMGLSICRELAELRRGSIEVESAIDRGTTFTLRLPLAKLRAGRGRARISEAATPEARPSGIDVRVLAAEDNVINQLVLKTLLHQIGVDPVVVENGKLAVEAGEFDVVLMDVQMPVMDGPAAARAIRERETAAGRGRTPIIALTANATSHQIGEYMATTRRAPCGGEIWEAYPMLSHRDKLD